MDNLTLFSLASQRTAWLGQRQAVVAENVANANTPGYTAKDVAPFADVLDQTGFAMTASRQTHLASLDALDSSSGQTVAESSWDVKHSGNSVVIEQEMLKAGEIARDYSLDTSVVKAFQRMLIMSVKS